MANSPTTIKHLAYSRNKHRRIKNSLKQTSTFNTPDDSLKGQNFENKTNGYYTLAQKEQF